MSLTDSNNPVYHRPDPPPRSYGTKEKWAALKSELTRAINSGDANKVLVACDHFVEYANEHTWPDTWHTWNIAASDAQWKLGLPPVGIE